MDYAEHYERLRQQALLPDPLVGPHRLEVTLIERRGVAAWMASRSGDAREDVKPLFEKRETEAGASDQVQILTDMILGKGERQGHD